MRIDRLDLIAFGPFTGVSLDLSRGSHGLHVVHGPNEAGKSSALRALRCLFCGFPDRLSDDWRHPYKALRVGAALRLGNGSSLEVVRRKGTKNTLLDRDGAALDDETMPRALGGEPPEEFVRQFVIDHAQLVEGGRSIYEGGGSLGRALFAAGGAGLATVGGVIRQLDADARELFKAGGKLPVINARFAEYEARRKEARDASLPSSEYKTHEAALADARARKVEVEGRLTGVERDRRRLGRLADAVAPAAKRAAVLAELAGLADAPRLSPGFGTRLADARSGLRTSERAEAEAVERASALGKELAALDVPEALLATADEIEALHQAVGGRRAAASDRRKRLDELAGVEAEALRVMGRIPGGSEEEGGDLHSRAAGLLARFRFTLVGVERDEMMRLADDRERLESARATARKAVDENESKRVKAAAKLAALGPEADPVPLKRALKEAKKLGPVDAQVADAVAAVRKLEAQAGVGRARLGPGLEAAPLDAIERLPAPSGEALNEFVDAFKALDRDEAALRREADAREDEARNTEAKLAALDLVGDVPTEAAVADARLRRDALWDRLKRAGAWDAALAGSYEADARAADDAADRLRREAERVTVRAGLTADLARFRAERDDRLDRLARLAADRAEVRSRWVALWNPAGLADPVPAEMRAWLDRHAKLAKLAEAAREGRAEAARLAETRDAHRRTIRAALAALTGGDADADAPDADEPLSALIDRAEEAVAAAESSASKRKKYREALDELDDDRPALDRAAADAEADRSAWQSRWSDAAARLGLDEGATTTAFRNVLNDAKALFERLERARALRAELDAADRDAGRHAAEVRALAAAVAPDLLGPDAAGFAFDPDAAALTLHARLKAARKAETQRDALVRERAERERAAVAARADAARARDDLAALRLEARCGTDDGLSEVDGRDRRRAALEAERDTLDALLSPLAAGVPLPTFLADVASEDPDELAPRAARLDEHAAALRRELEQANQAIGREATELARMTGGAEAADLEQDAQGLKAKAKAEAEQYARLRLASAVLQEGLRRYREKARSPVLARAGDLFRRLTLGSFDGLTVEYDDRDEPVLRGVRAGGETLGASAMSLGTADQLYLALRLATLEDHLDRHEPLPLVVDDVLVQFDDDRAAATLDALVDLSARTQVLMFTHHAHVLDLADARPGRAAVFAHTLPGRVGEAVGAG